MKTVHVGIGEAACGERRGALRTSGLGSCVAVAIYDRVRRRGGLIHYQLPYETDPERGREQPFLFGTPGLEILTQRLAAEGCVPLRCGVTVVGGAQIVSHVADAAIGALNTSAARSALRELGYVITREEVGGTVTRSVALDLASGEVTVIERGGRR